MHSNLNIRKEIMITGDGSHSVCIPERKISYRSKYGAIRESKHIFIDAGLRPLMHTLPVIHVLEIGFGTGLNALLTLQLASQNGQMVAYETVEKYPLEKSFTIKMNYCSALGQPGLQPVFEKLHDCAWGRENTLSSWFRILKLQRDIIEYRPAHFVHLIFFDPFDPHVQPELWERTIFDKLFLMMMPGAALLTYSSSGKVRRAMEAAGFIVQKMPGPPHKREIIKALKST